MGVRVLEGDSIRRVSQAEEEAEDLIEDAAEQAERIRSDSENEYSRKILSAQEKARRESAGLKVQVRREADEEIKAIQKNVQWECRMLGLQSGAKMDTAVRAVLEMLGVPEPMSKDGG
jgi:vacuolar-type H+-ATPase subunit H